MMTPEEWQRAKRLFGAALELHSDSRSSFIDTACAAESETVRNQVSSLLAAHNDSESFLEVPVAVFGSKHERTKSTLPNGHSIGPYTVQDFLGAGGMGQVYLAIDSRLARKVALKLLPADLAADANRVRRFEQEARTASALSHPNVCAIYEMGEAEIEDGTPNSRRFIAMEYVPGESLRNMMERYSNAGTRMPVKDAIDIAQQIAAGLEAAHNASVIHRDIKPENVIVRPDGLVKVLDFGLAKLISPIPHTPFPPQTSRERSVHTAPGMVLGTVQYMSPEQARGMELDERTDTWSLGAVLYEMIAGQPAFVGETPSDTMVAVLDRAPPSLSSLGFNHAEFLQRIIDRALAKDREHRFSSTATMAEELSRARTELESTPVKLVINADRKTRFPVRRRLVVLGFALTLTIAAVLAFRGSFRIEPSERDAQLTNQKYVVGVLPFENISADTANDYVAAGMTEEITGQLSQLSSLRVLTRSAVAPYQHAARRLALMSKELGVGSVVEGTVRAEGSSARIAVRLVDARSGLTIWSQQYDRQLSDLLSVQTEVGRSITTALEASLTPAEARRAGHPPTVDIAAYDLYMRSLQQSPEQAAKTLRRAIAIDPSFARAFAQLARACLLLGLSNPAEIDSGFSAAERALALDPDLAYAYFALGGLQSQRGHYQASRSSLLKAHQLDPNLFGALSDLSLTEIYLGHYDEALHWAVRAFPLAPGTSIAYYHLSIPLILLGDAAAAERVLLAAEKLFPDYPRVQMNLALLDFNNGRLQGAADRIRRVAGRMPDDEEIHGLVAEFAFLTKAEEAESLIGAAERLDPESNGFLLPETVRSMYGLILARRGATGRAEELWSASLSAAHRQLAAGDDGPFPLMEIAAISAIHGDTAAACSWLQRGYHAGFKDYRAIAHDPFFDGLRTNARFKQTVSNMESDVEVMRRRAAAENDSLFLRRKTDRLANRSR